MGRPKGSKNKKPQITTDVGEIIQNQSLSKGAEEVAEEEIRRAHEKNLPDPDFDFRTLYNPGDVIYYVWVNTMTGDKELMQLNVRTIYARSMVAWEEKGCAHMIGYNTRDMIFLDKREASECYKDVEVEAKYGG